MPANEDLTLAETAIVARRLGTIRSRLDKLQRRVGRGTPLSRHGMARELTAIQRAVKRLRRETNAAALGSTGATVRDLIDSLSTREAPQGR